MAFGEVSNKKIIARIVSINKETQQSTKYIAQGPLSGMVPAHAMNTPTRRG